MGQGRGYGNEKEMEKEHENENEDFLASGDQEGLWKTGPCPEQRLDGQSMEESCTHRKWRA